MTLAVYTGHETLTFPDYLDLGTGRTLHAEPGLTYDVAPASGRGVPDVPAGWFTVIRFATGGVVTGSASLEGEGVTTEGEGAPTEGDGAPPEPDSAQEPAGEPAHDEDPETDTPQQY